MTWLRITHGATLVTNTRLAGSRLVLGRSKECDIVLGDTEISRQHAELRRHGDGWVIRDLGSRNGVIVAGARVAGERALEAGVLVQLGPFALTLRDDDPPARATAVAVDGRYGPVRTMQDMAPPRLEARHLSTLLAFSGELLDTPERSQRQRLLGALMLRADFHGVAALLLRVRRDDPDAAPELLAAPALRPGEATPHVSRSLLHAVLDQNTAVLAVAQAGAPGPARAVQLSTPVGPRAMAAVACPITGSAGAMELLYVTLPSACSTPEWLALTMMAAAHYHQAEGVWSAREAAQARAVLEDEVRRAHELQMRLVPKDFASGPLDVAFGFAPCQAVGGDYIDAIIMDDGRLLLVAMDVAGKGLDAALIAASLHTTVHLCASHRFSLAQIVGSLNRYLIATWDTSTSVTLVASILDPGTGELTSINCGHPSPLIVARDGGARELLTFETMPLGFIEFDAETRSDRLAPGDMLVLYSDGLSELFDERDVMLDVAGVTEALARLRRAPDAATIGAPGHVERLHRSLAEYRGAALPSDDVSFIVVLAADRG